MNLKPQTLMPYIVDSAGLNQHGAPFRVQTVATDTMYHGIWPGMFVVKSTGGYVSVKGTETVGGNSTSFASADYFVDKIYDSTMNELSFQYVSVATLQVTGAVYYLDVKPIGGLFFNMTEDGDTTPITNANSSGTYAYVIIAEPSAPSGYNVEDAQVGGSFYIDSSTVTGTAGSTSVQIQNLANVPNPPYSATSGSQRVFKVNVRSAGASQSTQ